MGQEIEKKYTVTTEAHFNDDGYDLVASCEVSRRSHKQKELCNLCKEEGEGVVRGKD
jgi:hypothetical protein